MLYRIYCQNIQRQSILNEVLIYYDAFTSWPAIGNWEGHQETSLIIEIILNDGKDHTEILLAICDRIRKLSNQTSVLLIRQDCHAEYITKDSYYANI